MKKLISLIIVLAAISSISAESIRKPKTLVLLDNYGIVDTHSIFFSDLKRIGYDLDIRMINSNTYRIKEFGEYLYDQIILFCASENDLRNVKINQLVEFYDSGRNILFAADYDASKQFRQLVVQFGVDIHELGSNVRDHVFQADPNDPSIIKAHNVISHKWLQTKGDILYRGVGLTLSNYENFQIFGILRGNEYTYSKIYGENEQSIATGQNVALVAGVQGRNNARIIISGSLDLFSNEFFQRSQGVNRQFAERLARWAFYESGVLRMFGVHFNKVNETEQQTVYKILDELEYSFNVEEWDYTQDRWINYETDDFQLEFVMLDPWIRMPISHVSGTSKYMAQFKSPDRHGIFHFKVIYKRPGYTFFEQKDKVIMRPWNHNEYERYLFDASPYYLSVFATMGGFTLFMLFFLFNYSKH